MQKTITTHSAFCLPLYWEDAKAELMKRDRIMRKLIPQFGDLHLIAYGEPFPALARSVVGQQISVNLAEAVWQKFLLLCPKVTPMQVLQADSEQLAACGLSKRKVDYILDLANHFKTKRVNSEKWREMEDEDIIADLTQIRGIGRWTAEMFLIFNLLRPNIFPLDDLKLLKGISVNYFSGEPVSRSDAREVSANWEPWRTVATWYLWNSLDTIAS